MTTIVLTGGGSGGHITPNLAIAKELKNIDSSTQIVFIGQKKDNFIKGPKEDRNIDEVFEIHAGKFRRFSGEGLKFIFDISVILKNIRDLLYVLIGIVESYRLLKKIKPNIVFSRGGYVSVPVCLAAKLRHIPYITHDSDPIPSLANRVIAKWAIKHFVALPEDIYPYPRDKTKTTGIPISDKYVKMNSELVNRYRNELGIPLNARVILIIGGGLGSKSLNDITVSIVPTLLSEFHSLYVYHIAGQKNEEEVKRIYSENVEDSEQNRINVYGYINNVYLYSGSADLIICRAGATNLAEFALQGKAAIVVPGSFLAGGHQNKNAEIYSDQEAVINMNEDYIKADNNRLTKQVSNLLRNPEDIKKLESNILKFASPNATLNIAKNILELGQGK